MSTVPVHEDVRLAHVEESLVAGLPDLLDELETGLKDVSPDYAEFIQRSRGIVQTAAESAVHTLLVIAERVLDGGDEGDVWEHEFERSLFEEIGRLQWRQGIPIGTLLSAYQLGARVTWRQMSQRGLENGLQPTALAALAEAVFCFVDRLSTESTAGYLLEQSEAAAARERSREELVDLLLSDRSDSAAVRAAALRADWALPATAAVVLVEPSNSVGRDMVSRLDQTCLPVRRLGVLGAIIPDPAGPGRRERLARALRGSSAVIGHTVALEHLPASARIAEVAVQLQTSGVLSHDPIFVDEHLDAIIVNRDPRLLDALRAGLLAPLDRLSPASRESLTATLRSWLRTMGDRRAMAAELHVHPQTVRYRMGRLREVLGDVLDDPDARLRLVLALAWTPAPPSRSASSRSRANA